MVQTAAPTSDVAAGNWTDQAGGTTNLYATLDEAAADDTDFARAFNPGAATTLKLALGDVTAPAADSGHVIRYRLGTTGPGLDCTVALMQGASAIASWSHPNPIGLTTYARELTPAQAAAITDYTALDVWITAAPGADEMIVGAGNRLSAVGASNVNNIGVPPNIESDGFMYWVWAGASNNGRYVYHPQVAQGGETLAQTLARVTSAVNGFDAHVATYGRLPSHAIVQAGRNDMIFADPANVASKLTTYEAILDALLARGILPIVTGLLPSDNAASIAQHQRNRMLYNMGLALMSAKKGLPYIDPSRAIIDTATGALLAALRTDAEHPNSDGGKAVGADIVAKLLASDGITPYWDVPLADTNDANSDDAYLLGNMLMLADTGGQPTNWTEGGADVANLVTATAAGASDGILGDWMTMTKAATSGDAQNQSSSFTVTAGRWLAVGWAEKFTYGSGTPVVTTILRTSPSNTDLVYRRIQSDVTEDVPVSRHFQIVKVPGGDTSAVVRATMHAIGTYALGQVSIMDLTAYGLDDWI